MQSAQAMFVGQLSTSQDFVVARQRWQPLDFALSDPTKRIQVKFAQATVPHTSRSDTQIRQRKLAVRSPPRAANF